MRRPLRWLASLFSLQRQVRLVTSVLPSRYWYRTALAICRLQGALNGLLGGNRVLTEAVMLDHWLWELTVVGPFPIPLTLTGAEVIAAPDKKIGSILCWIHEPLVEFPLRPYVEGGYPDLTVLADPGRIVDSDQLLVAGLQKRLLAIPANRYSLARARRTLQEGMPIVCLADTHMGGPLIPLVLQLAARVGARVLFPSAVRRPDGTIDVTYATAPRPYCDNQEAIEENLAFLRAAQKRALARLGLTDHDVTQDTI